MARQGALRTLDAVGSGARVGHRTAGVSRELRAWRRWGTAGRVMAPAARLWLVNGLQGL